MQAVAKLNDIEEKQVLKAYRSLKRKMRNSLTEEDINHMDTAFKLANDGHKFQRRKSGEPYILHPIEVARICYEEIGLGPTAVISAILHDVVEDTEVTKETIHKMFGPKIGLIVDGLTKLDGLYNVESPQAENFKKVLSTLIDDVRVVLIKMADRLHNLRTIGPMPAHKQLKIAAETSYIYSPLAHRLGLYKVKTEFQDICMKITEPETYLEITEKLQQSKIQRSKYIREFIRPLKDALEELEITYRVIGRPKAISSIWNKIKTKKVPFEKIYDLFAVRIIIDVPRTKEKAMCWQIYSIITDVYKPIPERLKDWVTTPKGNGYESLHTTVIGPKGRFVEVQIRSERMDEIAERGFAAHWKYKHINNDNNVYDAWLDNIRVILDNTQSDALEFVNDFKTNLFKEEVYVFTPNGDMRILPKGATALDFAFDIHTDIGYKSTAIKVNDKLVPMGQKLKNGDQVSVTTSKNQKPNESWLKMAVTGKARSKIRSSMKEEQKKKGEFGKEALIRKFKKLKIDLEANIDDLVKHYGYKSRAELYLAVAEDVIKVSEINKFKIENGHFDFVKKEKEKEKIKSEKALDSGKKEKKVPTNKSNILVNGEPADQYDFSLATCCNPVQGDLIFGYLTAVNGLKIHRINCPNATNLIANYGYRTLKAEWSTSTNNDFVVDILITGVDSGVGVIQTLTNVISNNLGMNIRSFSIEGYEGYYEGKLSLIVRNINQLNHALVTLQKLEGVSNVVRINATETN
jgi:GTP pyrophosphokinase